MERADKNCMERLTWCSLKGNQWIPEIFRLQWSNLCITLRNISERTREIDPQFRVWSSARNQRKCMQCIRNIVVLRFRQWISGIPIVREP